MNLFQPIAPSLNGSPSPSPVVCENNEPLIQLTGAHPRIFMEPIYYQQQISNSLRVIYVREGVYERLQQALTLLPQEYCLLLYDGYRPFQVQQHLFSHFSQQLAKRMPQLTSQEIVQATKKYVAFPSKDVAHLAPHLTGGAIDVTLADVHGKALDLGTAFDEMNEKSATRYFEQQTHENPLACQHRRLLYNCMTLAGFTNYEEEWWHYDYGNVAWARRVQAQVAHYGAVHATIQNHNVEEFRFL
ncbi:M15 family metallopeptidase [Lysinibacillus sp. OL1_EC]|uniref:M15 family metallopeptidase n=1 Tax=unclassified Lysinibacillus TaxID=2636778 RepID=UPI001D106264|nr:MULTISPECIES: M15 family metallopeptidase [unclassified Lysinibacillus]MCM0623223.1 M15 family metallopeptidase [Lysinibacillus sp. OL1_EC]MCS5499995.1 M15 family metallopeptidase [Lysinibacillus sp. A4]UKJ46990.1 M15 family metallopeptidase [Lysinibacillus sp. ACHW1.5]WGT37075.1 M15 family metallopeptidase [Lysinibacillus sp. 1 U-2021]